MAVTIYLVEFDGTYTKVATKTAKSQSECEALAQAYANKSGFECAVRCQNSTVATALPVA